MTRSAQRTAGPRRIATLSVWTLLLALTTALLPTESASAHLPTGFSDTAVLSGLTLPTNVAFAPDGRVFVTEKRGVIKVFDGIGDATPDVVADLRTETFNSRDSGMNGLAVDPQFPERPYIYVTYEHDAPPGGTAPAYGTAGQDDDACPDADHVCVKTGRAVKLTLSGNDMVAQEVLLDDACQGTSAHAINDVQFGPEGALYVSAGDGASAGGTDYGQRGNVCGDPPVPAGTNQTAGNSEGGALRSQDARTTGDPMGLSGAMARIHPDTGKPFPGNPFAASSDVNLGRTIAFGLRNPYRFDFRPGSGEIYIGDVGWNTWDELNVIADVDDGLAENFGWPCYEGPNRQSGYDALNNSLCESLYTADTSTKPFYSYRHADQFVAGGECPSLGAGAISGVRFYRGGAYPDEYDGALFFSDYSRGCLMVMQAGPDGRPSPSTLREFSAHVQYPVDLEIGPGGDLYYVDIVGGAVRRISYGDAAPPPVAKATATPENGPVGTTVVFDASGSTDPGGGTLQYAWDLDGDNQFNDGSGATASRTYDTAARHRATVRVTGPTGLTSTATVSADIGVSPPTPRITAEGASGTWTAGKSMTFTGAATDAEDGSVPASGLSWKVTLWHCETAGCHAHPETGASGERLSFVGPDHSAPAYLDVVLTATDSSGLTGATTLRVDPETVALNLTSSPSGLTVTFDDEAVTTPATRTVIKGSKHSVSAASQSSLNDHYTFTSWSDGGPAIHDVTVGSTDLTLQATFSKDDLTHYRSVDLGGSGMVIDSVAWKSQAEGGITTNGNLVSTPDLVLTPETSQERAAMIRTARYRSTSMSVSMADVANSSYDVFVTVFEDNNPVVFDLALEGRQVLAGHSSGPAGTWQRLGPYRVTVADAKLDLVTSKGAVNVAGLELFTAGGTPPPPPPPVTSGAVDIGGAGGTIDGVVSESQAAAGVTTNGSLVSKPDLALSPGAEAASGRAGAPTIKVRPANLAQGQVPQVPYLFRGSLVHGDVHVRLPSASYLLAPSGRAYLVGVRREATGEYDVLRVQRDGSRRNILTLTWRDQVTAASDGTLLFRSRSIGQSPDFRTVINVHDSVTGKRISRRVFRHDVRVLDAKRNRVLLSKSAPTPRTVWWNHKTNTTRKIADQRGYFADVRVDRLATMTDDPYDGGCSVLRRLSAPARKLLRSCKERVEAVAPNGRRVATVDILSDGRGPGTVTVRGYHGRQQARYDAAGWFLRPVFETNRTLLMEANGRYKSAVIRCEAGACERASALKAAPAH